MQFPRLATLLVICLASVCQADTAEQIVKATGTTGGLIVHLGCGDGRLTASFGASDRFLVHGLDSDPKNVATAREHIKTEGLYGKVAVMQLEAKRLPYADNLVNLIVAENAKGVSKDEIMRVLCPGGVAYISKAGKWTSTTKPWPKDTDEWTHYLHGPDNNAVAHDSVVDVPRKMKWLGGPKFSRAHEQSASFTALVTTGGRMFYIVDEASRADIRIPSKWFLVARDAFNGVVLWKRPITKWTDQMRRFRSGPAEMAFRLAAKDDRVYVTLGLEQPVSILDAASGETVAICENTENARQVLRLKDKLIIMIDTAPESTASAEAKVRRGQAEAPGSRAIVVADAENGKTVWRKEVKEFVHPTLTAQANRLFYQTKSSLICVKVDSGDEEWRAERSLSLVGHEQGWESPTVVVHDKVVFCADFKQMSTHSVEDGSVLWKVASKPGYNAPPDVFVIDGLVWLKNDGMKGYDPLTGEVKKSLGSKRGYMHARCYRNKATDRFFLLGDLGVQFVDIDEDDASINHWVRGTCQYGILPANGLLYVTPDSCACNMKSKLAGLWAIESDNTSKTVGAPDSVDRLIKGPAFGKPPKQADNADSWPVHRHDSSRTGTTKATVAAKLTPTWKAKIGGKLSGVTASDDKVFVASVDTHTVYALDKATGKTAWSYTTGGRVDSPPTIHKGLALFGSTDGWVYALRADDGELAWRYRAAPSTKLTFVKGQLESVWPVHGSLIIHKNKLMVTAGRSSYLDDGIQIYQLDPLTGEVATETFMYSPDSKTGKQPAAKNSKDVQGVLTDILLASGDEVFMRHVKLDLQSGEHTQSGTHLFSPIGMLDDSWWHRAYWLYNDSFTSHWSGWWQQGNRVPSGRILCYDAEMIVGYGRDKYPGGNTGQFAGGEKHQLFACDLPAPGIKKPQPPKKRGQKGAPPQNNRWTSQLPLQVRAMLVADEIAFVAGPPDVAKKKSERGGALALGNPEATIAAWQGEQGGLMWAVSTKDGERLGEYELDSPPVFDGMAATAGQIYIATMDGHVVCLSN